MPEIKNTAINILNKLSNLGKLSDNTRDKIVEDYADNRAKRFGKYFDGDYKNYVIQKLKKDNFSVRFTPLSLGTGGYRKGKLTLHF